MTSHDRALPDDDAERRLIHDEVHARASARISLPAYVARTLRYSNRQVELG